MVSNFETISAPRFILYLVTHISPSSFPSIDLWFYHAVLAFCCLKLSSIYRLCNDPQQTSANTPAQSIIFAFCPPATSYKNSFGWPLCILLCLAYSLSRILFCIGGANIPVHRYPSFDSLIFSQQHVRSNNTYLLHFRHTPLLIFALLFLFSPLL